MASLPRSWGNAVVAAGCLGYDGAGNRILKTMNGVSTLSAYDLENRLTTEVAVSGFALANASTVSVSSGTNPSALKDGITTDSQTAGWISADSAVQHRATLDYGSQRILGKAKVFLPTGGGLAQRFKLQYWDGLQFQDLPAQEVVGAEPSMVEGWYVQTAHEVVFDCFLVFSSRLSYLQDAGGGAPSSANQAFVNELQGFEAQVGAATSLEYSASGLLKREVSLVPGPGGWVPPGHRPGSQKGGAGAQAHAMRQTSGPYVGGLPAFVASLGGGTSVETLYGYDWGYRLSNYIKGATSAAYVTDVLGRRLSKSVNGVTETYISDGEDVIGDFNASNILLARYTNGEGIDQKLSMARGGASYHYVPDALGGTQALLDAAQGVANRYAYTAWRESVHKTEAVLNRFQYTGREFASERGNYDYRARTYFQQRGGFGQRDPARSGENWYIYASLNPAQRRDPLGLEAQKGMNVEIGLATSGQNRGPVPSVKAVNMGTYEVRGFTNRAEFNVHLIEVLASANKVKSPLHLTIATHTKWELEIAKAMQGLSVTDAGVAKDIPQIHATLMWCYSGDDKVITKSILSSLVALATDPITKKSNSQVTVYSFEENCVSINKPEYVTADTSDHKPTDIIIREESSTGVVTRTVIKRPSTYNTFTHKKNP